MLSGGAEWTEPVLVGPKVLVEGVAEADYRINRMRLYNLAYTDISAMPR